MAGLYIHIPFCKSRCGYCDFHTSTELQLMTPLIESINKELELRKSYLPDSTINTIYFGGGTPSLLQNKTLASIFEAIYKHYTIADKVEVTLEANPDDLNVAKLQFLKTLPINRFSIGVQSLNDAELKLMNRRHKAQQAEEAVKNTRHIGFENITIDLIYGIPGQNDSTWKETLQSALDLPIKHISAYNLTYEENTPFFKMVQNKQIEVQKDEPVLNFFETLRQSTKEKGFEHYEISNFALQGYRSKHNSSYWQGVPYIGIGPSAHSYNGNERQWNIAHNAKYIKALKENKPFFECEYLSPKDSYNEFVITRMRTIEGCSMEALASAFGSSRKAYFVQMAQKFITAGSLEKKGDAISLSPKGIFISDYIISELMLSV